jgi:sugar phosphate isomerase/epimerase
MFDQIAINSNTYSGFTLEEAVKGAHAAGFTRIELAAVEHTPHVLTTMSAAELDRIKALLERYGMKVVGIGAHSNVMTEDGIANLLESIELANFFGCDHIITGTGEAHGDKSVISDEQILVNNLKPVLEKCQKSGKTLSIETHGNNYATGEAMKQLNAHFDHQIKINYDTGNVIFYGNTSPYKDLEASIDEVAFIHLKDKRGENKEWNFPAIGKGDIDFQRIFHTLEKANFTGPISVEIEFTPEGPADLSEVNLAVKASFHYLEALLDGEG